MLESKFKSLVRLRVIGGVAGVFALGLVAGCGDDSSGTGGGTEASGGGEAKRIVFSAYAREPEFIQATAKGLQNATQEAGWKLEEQYANNSPSEQVRQIENAITKQPDAIIVWPSDQQALIPIARQAMADGIKVVTMSQDFAKSGADAREFVVSIKYEELGAEKAKFIVKQLDGKGKVGIVRGIRGADFTEKQAQGADPVFADTDGIEVVATTYAGAYASQAGLDATQNILTAHSDIDALYVDNDDLALGAIQALEARGLLGKVPIVSTDGTTSGLDAVKAGKLDYTQALCGVAAGEQLIASLGESFEGKDPADFIPIKRVDATPDTYDKVSTELDKCS